MSVKEKKKKKKVQGNKKGNGVRAVISHTQPIYRICRFHIIRKLRAF